VAQWWLLLKLPPARTILPDNSKRQRWIIPSINKSPTSNNREAF
jgi:hypothetical protein